MAVAVAVAVTVLVVTAHTQIPHAQSYTESGSCTSGESLEPSREVAL